MKIEKNAKNILWRKKSIKKVFFYRLKKVLNVIFLSLESHGFSKIKITRTPETGFSSQTDVSTLENK